MYLRACTWNLENRNQYICQTSLAHHVLLPTKTQKDQGEASIAPGRDRTNEFEWLNCNFVDSWKTWNFILTSTNYIIVGLAIKLADCFISCENWQGIFENGQTLPKQLACEHAKDITFLSCEMWGNCIELPHSLFCMCSWFRSTDYSWVLLFFIKLEESISAPAEISCSLAPNRETLYITVLCFRFPWRYKKFCKSSLRLGGGR